MWPKSVTSLPPRPGEALSQCGSCGSSQTRQSASYLQGCGVTASFMRWHCLVLVDLTSLSPPTVFKGIWPSPSREEDGILAESGFLLPLLWLEPGPPSISASYPCGKEEGTLCSQPPAVGFKLPKIRMRLSARLSAQINIYCLQDLFQLLWLVPPVNLSTFSMF